MADDSMSKCVDVCACVAWPSGSCCIPNVLLVSVIQWRSLASASTMGATQAIAAARHWYVNAWSTSASLAWED